MSSSTVSSRRRRSGRRQIPPYLGIVPIFDMKHCFFLQRSFLKLSKYGKMRFRSALRPGVTPMGNSQLSLRSPCWQRRGTRHPSPYRALIPHRSSISLWRCMRYAIVIMTMITGRVNPLETSTESHNSVVCCGASDIN